MKRKLFTLTLLVFLVLACGPTTPIPATQTPVLPTSTATVTPSPTATSTEVETTPAVEMPDPGEFIVRVHPDGGLFVGDQVSFEVISPANFNYNASNSAQIMNADGELIGDSNFSPFGIGGRSQATFEWVWDTTGVEAGAHDLNINIQPGEWEWTYTVNLLPESELPPPEPDAQWAQDESNCCLIYYITGTASERDLDELLARADGQAQDVAGFLDMEFDEPIEIVLMSRVIGHGGFASGAIYITYIDRNYAGSDFDLVLHHEMVHILDARLGGDLRPSILVEGLAVYLTGGHFKAEPLIPRAAALLALEDESGSSWYLPLEPLADDFYTSQHEIGYLQAGALIEYVVDTYGWDAFSRFYRDIHHAPSGKPSEAIDAGLKVHFGIGFSELESRFLDRLRAWDVTQEHIEDVRLTIVFYDSARRYQQAFDLAAYFLSAWLPDGEAMRQYDIVADLLRHSSEVENLALETLLVSADEHLDAGNYSEANYALEAVNVVLSAMKNELAQPFQAHPLASTYYEVVNLMVENEYRPQRIRVAEDGVTVEALGADVEIVTFLLVSSDEEWQLYSD